jgi:hypothetical protein
LTERPVTIPVRIARVSVEDPGSRNVWDATAVALVVLAAGLRIALWLQERSLWIDEARLSLNIASRTYLQLFPPLDYNQAAPPLYLWLERAVVDLLGVGEGALRLPSLLAGIATVALVYAIGHRLFGRPVALLATAVAALSPTLVYFSSEVKQYAVEAFVGCIVVYLGLGWLDAPRTCRRWYRLVAVGAIAVWLAAPAPFVLAAVGLAVLLMPGLEARDRILRTAHLGFWWAGSLGLAYLWVYRHAADDVYLRHYWGQAFLTPGRDGVLLDAGVAVRGVLWAPVSALWGRTAMDTLGGPADLVSVLLAPAISAVIALTAVIGVRRLARARRAEAVLTLAPLVLAFLASMLALYPISARTTAFYMPILLILVCAGIEEVAGRLRRPILVKAVPFAACLPLALLLLGDLGDSDPREHIQPLVASIESHRRANEPVYVFTGAIPAWAMYTTDWDAPDTARLAYVARIAGSRGAGFENAASRRRRVEREGYELTYRTAGGPELYGISHGLEAKVFGLTNAMPDPGWAENEASRIRDAANPTAWLIFSHFYGPEGQLLHALEARGGRRTYEDLRNGAALFRYEFPS